MQGFLLGLSSGETCAAYCMPILIPYPFFLTPVPFIGLLRGVPALHTIGEMAAGLIGAYYLATGAAMLAGGVDR